MGVLAMETLIGSVITAIAGLVGVVLGGWIVSHHAKQRDERERDAATRGVRSEIEYNRKILKEIAGKKLGEKLPTRSTQIWNLHLSTLIEHLDDEEFKKVHGFYTDLNDVWKTADNREIMEDTRLDAEILAEKNNPLPDKD